MDIKGQYNLDDAFKAKARLHQSNFRAAELKVNFNEYGNRLCDEEGKKLLNYYDDLNCKKVLRNRYPNYSSKRDADMLRSEHIPFNLIAPLDLDHEVAKQIIEKSFGIRVQSIDYVKMEFAPGYLNDGTAFDAYIQAKDKNGCILGIGIEIKYTEKAYKIGVTEKENVKDHNSMYWETARKSDCFKEPDNNLFGTDELRQVWRNHLLGLKMKQKGIIDDFYSITIFPQGNAHFNHVLPVYIDMLKLDSKKYVIGCTFENFISTIDGPDEFLRWKNWLQKRYLVV